MLAILIKGIPFIAANSTHIEAANVQILKGQGHGFGQNLFFLC